VELTAKNILISVGFILIIIGMGLNVGYPTIIQGHDFTVDSGQTHAETIFMNSTEFPTTYTLQFQFTAINDTTNGFTMEIVNDSEYIKYIQGTPVTDLNLIPGITKTFDNSSNATLFSGKVQILPNSTYYLLITNWNSSSNEIIYFYSSISQNYYYGLEILGYGSYLIIAVLIYSSTGWKRYFLWGFGINLGAFLLKIALLTSDFSMVSALNDTLHLEMYSDYVYYTMNWATQLWQGINLYATMPIYLYTPLFMLTTALFNILPFPAWKFAIPIFFCNIATGYLIFKIVFQITKNEYHGTIAMLFYFLNPFILIYGSVMWLNPPLFVFFILLAFYLILQKKSTAAMIVLGIAVMYKQFAIFFFPILLIILLKNAKNKSYIDRIKLIVTNCFWFFLPIFLISLPFLIWNSQTYLSRVLISDMQFSLSYFTTFDSSLNSTVRFTSIFFMLNVPSEIIEVIGYLLALNILLLGWLIFVYGVFFLKGSKILVVKNDSSSNSTSNNLSKALFEYQNFIDGFFWAMILVFGLQLFYSRGSYKYYLILLMPFLAMFIIMDWKTLKPNTSEKFNKITPYPIGYTIALILTWTIFFINRFTYFAILIVWVIYFLYKKYQMYKVKHPFLEVLP
jgi:hypothetical protein